MSDVKNIELKNIYISSVAKFFGGIFLIVGLIIGLFGNIFRIDTMSPEVIRIFPFLARLRSGILAGIVFGIIYGLSAAVGSSICATLYNFFATLLGGLKFSVKE